MKEKYLNGYLSSWVHYFCLHDGELIDHFGVFECCVITFMHDVPRRGSCLPAGTFSG